MEIFLYALITAFIGTFVTTSAKLIATHLFGDKKKTTQASPNVVVVLIIL